MERFSILCFKKKELSVIDLFWLLKTKQDNFKILCSIFNSKTKNYRKSFNLQSFLTKIGIKGDYNFIRIKQIVYNNNKNMNVL